MSLSFQKKIMRVVEYKALRRVGGTQEIKIHARVIAATNADLPQLMQKGHFLSDLYDRLAFEEIRLPPLRARKGDISLLAEFFMERFMMEVPHFKGKQLSKQALAALENYAFPGNVRELKNLIERAVYRDTTNLINAEDIGMLPSSQPKPDHGGSFKEQIETLEIQLLQDAMRDASGNQAEAARLLGLSYHQFRHYLKKHAAHLGTQA